MFLGEPSNNTSIFFHLRVGGFLLIFLMKWLFVKGRGLGVGGRGVPTNSSIENFFENRYFAKTTPVLGFLSCSVQIFWKMFLMFYGRGGGQEVVPSGKIHLRFSFWLLEFSLRELSPKNLFFYCQAGRKEGGGNVYGQPDCEIISLFHAFLYTLYVMRLYLNLFTFWLKMMSFVEYKHWVFYINPKLFWDRILSMYDY